MTSLLRAAPLLCGALLAAGFAQSGPGGHWEGTVQLPNREIQLALDLAKNDSGAWIGSLSSGENARGIPLADLKVEDRSVSFRVMGGPEAPSSECTLESPDSLRCTVTSRGGSVPFTLKRTGEAKVDLPKPSPAVSAELEGDWKGAIDMPNGSLTLIVHFKNLPDKTVHATLDSPDQNSTDLPLTDVLQKGSAVEFRLRMVGGAYKGSLNKDATQLDGEWSQGGNSLPLTLRKSVPK